MINSRCWNTLGEDTYVDLFRVTKTHQETKWNMWIKIGKEDGLIEKKKMTFLRGESYATKRNATDVSY